MRSFRIFNQRAGAVLAAASLVFASLIPAMASADTVTSRSIALSTSVKAATSNYEVKFTVPSTSSSTGAFVLEFCDDPTINTACNTTSLTTGGAAGIDTSTVATSGSDTVTAINTNKAVKVVLASAVAAGASTDVVLTGIKNPNPTTAGVFYARIVTYTDSTALTSNYVAANNLGTYIDDGSVALSTTDGFSISGRALETMTFCASGATISDNCVTTSSPNISLGTNGVLDSTLDTGVVYTKISTNAAHGAVVNLRSGATGCGGLKIVGTSTCGIPPTGATPIAINTGDGKFGMKLTLAGGTAVSGSYDQANYAMNYVGGDTSGVTGPYGDAIYNTGGGAINQGTANLTFGANVSPTTPAGQYSATFNLIATGTF